MSNNTRPLLLFKHNPKAAGGTILAILDEIKPDSILKTRYDELIQNGTLHTAINADTTFVRIRESSSVTPVEQKHAFVISSIREPCAHYVSLWSYGSSGQGGKRTIETCFLLVATHGHADLLFLEINSQFILLLHIFKYRINAIIQ